MEATANDEMDAERGQIEIEAASEGLFNLQAARSKYNTEPPTRGQHESRQGFQTFSERMLCTNLQPHQSIASMESPHNDAGSPRFKTMTAWRQNPKIESQRLKSTLVGAKTTPNESIVIPQQCGAKNHNVFTLMLMKKLIVRWDLLKDGNSLSLPSLNRRMRIANEPVAISFQLSILSDARQTARKPACQKDSS